MRIIQATVDDIEDLARLLWIDTLDEEPTRGQGIGSALVEAASQHASQFGAGRITVQSGRKAVPVYERLGFESSRQLLQRQPC